MRTFVERGGPWVAVQFLWLAAVVVVGRLDVARVDFPGRSALGWGLMVAAVLLGLAAAGSLGRNLTPFPKPVVAGSMVVHGPYRVVRHPIYSAVVVGMCGIALRGGSWLALLLALGLLPFFYAKSSFEERHLAAQYPDYADYQRRVGWRLIPGML